MAWREINSSSNEVCTELYVCHSCGQYPVDYQFIGNYFWSWGKNMSVWEGEEDIGHMRNMRHNGEVMHVMSARWLQKIYIVQVIYSFILFVKYLSNVF